MTERVVVVDYGMGNLHSVACALGRTGANVDVLTSGDPAAIRNVDRLVFPGVGAIRDCMSELRRLGLDQAISEVVGTRPVLAICVGMQALMTHSEENEGVDTLDVIPGRVRFFGLDHRDAAGQRLKVPHMGWNQVHQSRWHPLWGGIGQDERFYFVHSYYVEAEEAYLVSATCEYGVTLHAALSRGNLFAVQFHPEKSARAGLRLMRNFVNWNGHC